MRSFAIVLGVLAVGGCASIVDGSSQSLSVKTASQGADVSAAACEMKNDKGQWYVTTPGSVTVHRSADDLNVKCTHDGYSPSIIAVKSTTKAMAFGNILFGGLIGAGVDVSTGAAFDYPSVIAVDLQLPAQ